MSRVTVQASVDEDQYNEAKTALTGMGLMVSTFIRMSLAYVAQHQQLPFKLSGGVGRLLGEYNGDKETERKQFTCIPAHPDFYIIELVQGGKVGYRLSPIIGWEFGNEPEPAHGIQKTTVVYPVTVEGLQLNMAIVYPDGSVCVPKEATYESIDSWVESQREKNNSAEGQ